MDFINDITIKNSKLNFNIDPAAVDAGSVKVFNITGVSKVYENQDVTPSEFGALYIGRKDVANDCLVLNADNVDIIFDTNIVESNMPCSLGLKRNVKFLTGGFGIKGSEISIAANTTKINTLRGIILNSNDSSIISFAGKSNLIAANNSIDLVAYNDYGCNGSCTDHNSINFYTKRRYVWPSKPNYLYCGGSMQVIYTEFPDVAFGKDRLTFSLPSQFNDSITVSEPKSGGNSCESSLSNNYGLYVDSTSFTYDNGTQAIDINPLTGMQFLAKCGDSGIDFKFGGSSSYFNVSTDGGPGKISLTSGCMKFETSEFKFSLSDFDIIASGTKPSRITSSQALTIEGGTAIDVGKLLFGDDINYNKSVILEHSFNCTTTGGSGCLTLNSKYGNVLIASGCINGCADAEIIADTYINLDKNTGIDIITDKTVSISGSDDGTSKFVSDVPATFNEKAIFNDGICTKTITSIAGTPIFDTTDGKGFNFKGLYTLNGFGTTNKPFFKQESATNNWIDVTTLKEGGTALEAKYALKSDIPADVDLSNYAQKATTLSGYGITDAYTKAEIDLKDTAFLTKDSDGIQTISSDLALTGYVLIDNLAIDELNIESLSASSMVTLSGGLTVTNGGIVANSIKVGNDPVALVSSLSNYVLKTDISNVYKYVGSVNTVSELPTNLTEADAGIVYNIVDASTSVDLSVSAGDNVAWTGTTWDKLGGSLDLSNYVDINTKNQIINESKLFKSGLTFGKQSTLTEDAVWSLDSLGLYPIQTSITGGLLSTVTINKITTSTLQAIYLSGGILGSSPKLTIPTEKSGTLALTSDIPDVSSFITKDVSDLTNYETKTVAEGKYAQKSTTLSGYGITDAYTKTEIDSKNVSFLTKESSGIQTVSSDLALTGYVLIDNLSIDELNIESLTANSLVTLSGGLNVTGNLTVTSGTITVGGKKVATKDETPIFKYFQNPVVPASCTLFAIATNAEFENMPMMQLVRNSDNTIVSADISWISNSSGGHDIMVGIDHSSEISANTYTLHAFGY